MPVWMLHPRWSFFLLLCPERPPRAPQLTRESPAGPGEAQGATQPRYCPPSRGPGSQQLGSTAQRAETLRQTPSRQIRNREGTAALGERRRTPQLPWDVSGMHRAGVRCNSRHWTMPLERACQTPWPHTRAALTELPSRERQPGRGSCDHPRGAEHCSFRTWLGNTGGHTRQRCLYPREVR